MMTAERIKALLREEFEVEGDSSMPFLIREHQRKYQVRERRRGRGREREAEGGRVREVEGGRGGGRGGAKEGGKRLAPCLARDVRLGHVTCFGAHVPVS